MGESADVDSHLWTACLLPGRDVVGKESSPSIPDEGA